ncbi:alpha-ketoglutarate-dependent dioxygenase alkB homolog 3-like [Branchiostoma floridae x Branchiostoma belcheri]
MQSSDDKRRRLRLQGSRAVQAGKPVKPFGGRGRARGGGAIGGGGQQQQQPGYRGGEDSASSTEPRQMLGSKPTWLEKDERLGEKSFVFQQPAKAIRKPPEPQVFKEEGVFEISTSPSGVSRLRYFPHFIDPKEADWMFDQLEAEIPWRQRKGIDREGVEYLQPRLTAWYGELPYSYSRLTHDANPHWHPVVTMLRDHITQTCGHTFNSVLCNLYRDDKDSIAWHSDNEYALRKNPIIASLTLGAIRTFELRKNPPPEENGDYTYTERVKIPLNHGSLLIMEGATQEDWQHRVPKEYHDREARINLTFRTIYPEEES